MQILDLSMHSFLMWHVIVLIAVAAIEVLLIEKMHFSAQAKFYWFVVVY
jgi:hypothetical protein